MGRVTRRAPSHRLDVSGPAAPVIISRPDTLAVEEPLEIRVGGVPLAVTMRSPGNDFDLAIGFLLTEGLIGAASDVRTLMHCQDQGDDGLPTYNVVDVTLSQGVTPPAVGAARQSFITSSCGICGKASIDAITTRGRYTLEQDHAQVDPRVLAGMPQTLRKHQAVFDQTGGLHAAGLFTAEGELLVAREDVGRHNAVDKVIGWAAREERLPLRGQVLCVSGRASFELTQKALMAGIPVLAAVSAPSSLAVELATESGMTLVGFVRAPKLTVYSGPGRLGIQPH
ncbi:MAG: formate dehydrogenase accessory sulfurtransferase FdhD [Dermatophilaceae bacterium]